MRIIILKEQCFRLPKLSGWVEIIFSQMAAVATGFKAMIVGLA